MVANQAQRWLRDGGKLVDTSVTRTVKLSESALEERNCQASIFFFFLLTSAFKIRWMENGGHESDNGFILKSHTLFKQPPHASDSHRQRSIDGGVLIREEKMNMKRKRPADVER